MPGAVGVPYWSPTWPRSGAGGRGTPQRCSDRGVGCVLAFPLSIGTMGFGVLEGYDAARAEVDSETTGMMTAFARVATEALVDGPGTDGSGARELSATLEPRVEIHQAQGMVMVALEVTLVEALLRMRAHAFAIDVPLLVLAQEILGPAQRPTGLVMTTGPRRHAPYLVFERNGSDDRH